MMTDDQIKGRIADAESQLQTLATNHQKMVDQFNQAVANNQAQFHQLQGQLAAWRSMLPEKKQKKAKK